MRESHNPILGLVSWILWMDWTSNLHEPWQRCRWAVWCLCESDFFHTSLQDPCLVLHSGITDLTTTTHLPHTNFLLIAPKQLGVADQALEVLLASKHALVDSQGFGYLRVWVAYVMSLEFFFPSRSDKRNCKGQWSTPSHLPDGSRSSSTLKQINGNYYVLQWWHSLTTVNDECKVGLHVNTPTPNLCIVKSYGT